MMAWAVCVTATGHVSSVVRMVIRGAIPPIPFAWIKTIEAVRIQLTRQGVHQPETEVHAAATYFDALVATVEGFADGFGNVPAKVVGLTVPYVVNVYPAR